MKGFLLITALVSGLTFARAESAQQKPLTQIELTALLATGSSGDRLAWLIQNRGVDFIPDEAFLKCLKDDGASGALLSLLKSENVRHGGASVEDAESLRKDAEALTHLHLAAQANRNNFHPRDAESEFRAARYDRLGRRRPGP